MFGGCRETLVVNRVAKEIAEREAKLLYSSGFDAADVSDEHSASFVAFVDSGLSCGDHLDVVDVVMTSPVPTAM